MRYLRVLENRWNTWLVSPIDMDSPKGVAVFLLLLVALLSTIAVMFWPC
jgi:hypothetical protein